MQAKPYRAFEACSYRNFLEINGVFWSELLRSN